MSKPAPRRSRRAILPLLLLALSALAAVPSGASANTYTVLGCHDVAGNRLTGTGGFREIRPPGGPANDERFFTSNSCADSGKGSIELSDGFIFPLQPLIIQDATSKIELRFTAPPNTGIVSYQFGKLGGQLFAYSQPTGTDGGRGSVEIGDSAQTRFSAVGQGFVPVGSLFVPFLPAPVSSVFARVGCEPVGLGGRCTMRSAIAQLNIDQTRVRVDDRSVPTATNVIGSLTSTAALKGTADLEFDATDDGPGIAGSTEFVDGQSRGFAPISSFTCRNLGGGFESDITYDEAVPCPTQAHISKTVDTTKLTDGLHNVRVEITTASGNIGRVFERTILVKNGLTPNGQGASTTAKITASLRFAGRTRDRVTLRYGQGGVILNGKVQGTQPVVNGLVDIGVRERSLGARTVKRTVRTGSDGSFTFRVPAGRSQDVTASYRAFLEARPVTRKTLRIDAIPRVSFNVSRRGRSATFSGTLFGAPPRSRKVVVLQVRKGKGFQPFGTVRMNHGHYKLPFRFLSGGSYTFRARVLAEAGWPFNTATSRILRLTVR